MATYVISLGGSIIVPDAVNTAYLKPFAALIRKRIAKGDRFVIICGGGSTARNYMNAAAKIHALSPIDLDWLGIHASRLNGHLLRSIFRDIASLHVVKNPNGAIPKGKVVIAAGWKPGRSTDNVATLIARKAKIKTIINVSNIDYVYDKDPKKFKNAKPVKEMSWQKFRKLVGNKWDPGLNLPFDPIAAKVAEKENMKVFVVGKSLTNLEKIFSGKKFVGTTLSKN